MKVAILASGSSGNATIVASPQGNLLIDAGIPLSDLEVGLEMAGLRPQDLGGILLTHEHRDHVAHLAKASQKWKVPAYCSETTWKLAGKIVGQAYEHRSFVPGEPFMVENLHVRPFPVLHDAVDPVGFLVAANGHGFCHCTDLGSVTEAVREQVLCADVLNLEFNHDIDVLTGGPYPAYLKKRILGKRGHLSNDDAAGLLAQVAGEGRASTIFLGHISKENNRVELAFEAAERAVKGHDLRVLLTRHRAPAEVVEVPF